MTYVLDSSAVIAVFRDEEGAEFVRDLLAQPDNHFGIHAVNLIEVYYRLLQTDGETAAVRATLYLRNFDVRIRERMDSPFCRDAARLKAQIQHVSLADCICIALAREVGGTALTADRGEFTSVRDARLCRVRFIR